MNNSRLVFISYKREGIGKENAIKLEKLINETENLRAFRDETDIDTSNFWQEKIDKAIQDSYAVVVILTTKAAQDAKWVTYEWAYALGLGKPVLPLVFEAEALDLVHDKLKASINYDISFLNPNDEVWTRHINLLQRLYEQTHVPSTILRAADAAEDWRKDNREEALEFLRYNTHHSTFDVLATLCNSYFPETAMLAACKLGNKVADSKFNHPFTNKSEFLLKAMPGIENALLNGDIYNLGLNTVGRFDNLEATIMLYNAYKRADEAMKGVILKAILQKKHESIIPVLQQIKSIDIGQTSRILVRLAELEDNDSLQDIEDFITDDAKDINIRRSLMDKLITYKNIDACRTLLNITKHFAMLARHRNRGAMDMAEAALQFFQEIATSHHLRESMDMLGEITRDSELSIIHTKANMTHIHLERFFLQHRN